MAVLSTLKHVRRWVSGGGPAPSWPEHRDRPGQGAGLCDQIGRTAGAVALLPIPERDDHGFTVRRGQGQQSVVAGGVGVGVFALGYDVAMLIRAGVPQAAKACFPISRSISRHRAAQELLRRKGQGDMEGRVAGGAGFQEQDVAAVGGRTEAGECALGQGSADRAGGFCDTLRGEAWSRPIWRIDAVARE